MSAVAAPRAVNRLAVRALALSPLLAFGLGLFCCAAARATFEPATLVSGNPALGLQADYAYDPAISADGAYVAFTGSVASAQGIYRKELASGRLESVARGIDTGAPSISADGRYVSFTTDENPATGESGGTGACSSVYVRDMDTPIDAPGAFTLASAPDEAGVTGEAIRSLSYQPTPGQPCGSAAAARVALSADGRRVAFTILSPSDLSGACTTAGQPPALSCPTPPDQVAVRDLDARGTTLVSVTSASLAGTPTAVPGGGALTGPTSSGSISLAGGGRAELAVGASTAAISADGSTVAWMGVEVGEQAELSTPVPSTGHTDGYAEPLWRRIADGPTAPTRRVLAGEDASAPACPPECPGGLDLDWDTQGISPQEYTGAAPEFGSYTSRAATGFAAGAGFTDPLAAVTPQLSADGMTVALLSTQPSWGEDPNFGIFDQTKPPPANAFVVRMSPGLTRTQAIQRLTDWASLNFTDPALSSPVTSIALSPDATRVAFTTQRIAFPLAPPALITPPLSQAGATQLYEANLAAGTLQLVSQGYDGQPADDGVYAAALSADGQRLALASAATNLAYGVVNEGSDVFLASEVVSPPVRGAQSVTPLPAGPAPTIPWGISATAAPSRDGSLLLYVTVPGAGSLSASAVAAVPAHRTNPKARKSARVAPRTVARAATRTKGPGVLELHLLPAARYGALAASRAGLYATITVTFTAPGHAHLTTRLRAGFPRRSHLYDIPRPGRHQRARPRTTHGHGTTRHA